LLDTLGVTGSSPVAPISRKSSRTLEIRVPVCVGQCGRNARFARNFPRMIPEAPMSRPLSPPRYRLHKNSGQAIVTLPDGLGNRRDVSLENTAPRRVVLNMPGSSPNGRPPAAARCHPAVLI
jgi:hypothetical protein